MIENEDVTGTEQPSSVKNSTKMEEDSSLTADNVAENKEADKVEKVEMMQPPTVEVEKPTAKNKEEENKDTNNQEPEGVAVVEEKVESAASEVKITTEDESVEAKSETIVDAKDKKVAESKMKVDELADEDFSTYSKEKLVDLIKILAKHDDPFYAERYLKKIDPLFAVFSKTELAEAKAAYIKENGNEEGFNFRADELTSRFEANTRLIHDRKHAFSKDREAQRQANLKKAEGALEKLRLFVDSEESSAGFNKFKEIQTEWKAIGDVPGNQSKTLWANYNALINRFYDQRSIYFELKELDRKKNYEAKIEICKRAEALTDFENLKEAINTLNDLHSDYKHLGPVPQELQEELWVRFKAASDKVYERRKEFVSDLKVVLYENLAKKIELVSTIKLFLEFDSDRIKEWNSKTKELLELQKKWESIGGLPREKSKNVTKDFWSSFKTFFHNKSNFFKKLDAERKANYDLKLVLVEKAEALKENTDWFKTANDFKALQQEWKTIGPVPEKVRNKLYDKFKAACDAFFDNKRSQSKDDEKNYKENLRGKKDIIAQIKEWVIDPDSHIEEFKQKAKKFIAIGFVPRKDIGTIKDKFSEAVNEFITALKSEEEVKNALRMEIELGDLLGAKDSEKAIYGKEQNLRRQLQQLENDAALWKNNLEFFAHSKSKNADDLRRDVNQKIEKAEAKVATLKGQLKLLRLM
ncbi:hypothetical protein MNBD_UNCLBAC01-465 [hydrothermal vent metagenome]|uniref:DUF349 domain-containing protein n=1 Tax=hydrothermal vent metagenome TaxID=652676 RepID=A0A3B1DIY4_9ZZZZ